MRELEAEQQQVQEDPSDLLRDIESHAAQLLTDADPKIGGAGGVGPGLVEKVWAAGLR